MNIITSFALSLSFVCECQSGVSALYAAAQNGHDEVVRTLLEFGADRSVLDQVSYTFNIPYIIFCLVFV